MVKTYTVTTVHIDKLIARDKFLYKIENIQRFTHFNEYDVHMYTHVIAYTYMYHGPLYMGAVETVIEVVSLTYSESERHKVMIPNINKVDMLH